jgi:hypothetical protein
MTSLKGAVKQGGVDGCRSDSDVENIVGAVRDEVEAGLLQLTVRIKRICGKKLEGCS